MTKRPPRTGGFLVAEDLADKTDATSVEGSIASPAFGGGSAFKYRLPRRVQELIDAGVLGVK